MNHLCIVGYWNSGTTLLVDLLRKHPQLRLRHARYKPNLEDRSLVKMLRRLGHDFIRFEPRYQRVIEHGWDWYQQPQLSEAERARFRRMFLRHYRVKPPQWLLLKNPWLWFMPDFLRENFTEDQMRYVVILREGGMQAASKDYWLRDPADPPALLRARGQFWVRAMEFFYQHWHDRPDVYVMRYENLCADPVGEVQALLQWIGLAVDPLRARLPQRLTNRTDKLDQLPPGLREELLAAIASMQARIDVDYPVQEE